jgi:hypothetical protein
MKTNKTNNLGRYLIIGFIGLSAVFTACDEKVPQKKTEKPDDNTPANTIATNDICIGFQWCILYGALPTRRRRLDHLQPLLWLLLLYQR